jgi:tRNA G18 (ribose-2'-O)-methylase SpoU
MSGYFSIGIEQGKTVHNIGTLWRSAYLFDASYIFTINKRYKKQASDTQKTWRQIPLFNYMSLHDLKIPYDCKLIGVELVENAISLPEFKHPKRAIYLLGAEDHGLTKEAVKKCHEIIQIPYVKEQSANVAVTGSIVMYDRYIKENLKGGSNE